MFKDKTGAIWKTDFAFDTFRRESATVDLSDVEQVIALMQNQLEFLALAHRLNGESSIDFDLFLAAMDGETFDAAIESFWESWINFSPPRMRSALGKMRDAMKAEQAKALAEAERAIAETEQSIGGLNTHTTPPAS